ncbi:MAG: hypothetical protein IPM60_05145 [Rhodospirillales bacterium]|nr:hypothetical protein [Rhodospirillales bacterium]
MGNLDWKWVGIGVLIMLVLSLLGGIVLTLLMPEVRSAATVEELEAMTLSGGQAFLAAAINFLAFVIGGFIVGWKSAGRTIIEPGISAAVAVLIALLLAGNFTVMNLLVGGLIPFAAGVLGGWLGERRQDATRAHGASM